tara:strand:+ start:1473 stop:2150 length:678 start_codon:yes stop_codon:yes gene_type:complete
MLALKQGLSLVSTNTLGGWQPSDETGLEAWYKYQSGITLNGSDVSAWADSSENSFDMVQATATEQPAYNSGAIEFTPADTHNLQSASDITLSGAFTIGIKLEPDASNLTVLGSNTTPNEFFKISTSTTLRFKTDGSQIEITLDSGSFVADLYLVVTRNASNLITLYKNGVAQADTETLAGTADINAIGVRRTDLNPYDGTISEIQIFDTESTALTANVNTYLSNI